MLQRIREETELQLAEEGLKIREMEAFAKQLNGEMDKQHTLANKYQTNAMQLDCQRSKFMQELNSVRFIFVLRNCYLDFYEVYL